MKDKVLKRMKEFQREIRRLYDPYWNREPKISEDGTFIEYDVQDIGRWITDQDREHDSEDWDDEEGKYIVECDEFEILTDKSREKLTDMIEKHFKGLLPPKNVYLCEGEKNWITFIAEIPENSKK